MTPPAVRDELSQGSQSHSFLTTATEVLSDTIPVVELDDASRDRCEELTAHLDRGEAEALAIAECHDGLIVTDDGAARNLAREHGVSCPIWRPPDRVRLRAKALAEATEDDGLATGAKPTAFAGACLYEAAQSSGCYLTQAEVANAAGTSENTVRKHWKALTKESC